jgi:hypothetical protein
MYVTITTHTQSNRALLSVIQFECEGVGYLEDSSTAFVLQDSL